MKVTQLILSIHITNSEGKLKSNPEVLVGKLPIGMQLRQPTIVDEPKTWMIHHNADYTHYSLYIKNIVVAPGVIGDASFNLLLPVNQKIERFTVLEVLTAVENMWGKNMYQSSKGGGNIGHEDYERYIAQIPLTERELFFPEMKGDKPAAHCISNKNQLGAMLNFSRYPILSTISWLELGHDCDTTINLPIPQKDKPATLTPSPTSVLTPSVSVPPQISPHEDKEEYEPEAPETLSRVTQEQQSSATLQSNQAPQPSQKQEEVIPPPTSDTNSDKKEPTKDFNINLWLLGIVILIVFVICWNLSRGTADTSYAPVSYDYSQDSVPTVSSFESEDDEKEEKSDKKSDDWLEETIEDKIKSEEKKDGQVTKQPTKAELIAEIEKRPDFPEFMDLVNNLKYSECEKHAIFIELKKGPLVSYIYAIYNVCKPVDAFDKQYQTQTNSSRKKFCRSLPMRYNFNTLDEIKKESIRIEAELKKIK